MTIGLDTSVLLRLLTGQPVQEAAAARRRLEQALDDGDDVVVTDLVLAEAYFALQFHYSVPKRDARRSIATMLRSNVVRASPADGAAAFEADAGAGVVDRLIHARHAELGAVTLTFDRKMSSLPGATRIR